MVSRLDGYEDDMPEYKSDLDKLDERIKAVSKHVHAVSDYAQEVGADLGVFCNGCIRRQASTIICVTVGMLMLGISFGIAISTLCATVGELQQRVEALEKQK